MRRIPTFKVIPEGPLGGGSNGTNDGLKIARGQWLILGYDQHAVLDMWSNARAKDGSKH